MTSASRRCRRAAALASLIAGAALVAHAAYIPAKAAVAQVLLERAWTRVQNGERGVRPWPWADITPVAALEIPRQRWSAIVLSGTSGEALAFGPGHMTNSAAIGFPGTAIVAAHRDTQFRVLRELRRGDAVVARTRDGRRIVYRVVESRIVRADASGLDPADAGAGGGRLALVTCYPFEGVLRSSLRYVVIAERERTKRPKGTTLLSMSWPISARPR